LVLVYLVSIGNGGTNYPPGLSKPLWHSNDFYLQPVVGYHSLNPYRLWWYGRRLSDIDRNIESMTIMPGRHDYVSGGSDNYDRQGGQFYIDSWREVLKYNTKIVILCDWNNWNEEYALEGCIGSNGWKDLNNISTFDWY